MNDDVPKRLVSRSRWQCAALLAICLATLLIWAPAVQAATPIYVRPGGDDTLCNGTVDVDYSAGVAPNCAVQTIQQGISLVDPGGTVYVAAGTYPQTASISITKSLTLAGNPAGDRPQVTFSDGNYDGFSLRASNVTLRDLWLSRAGNTYYTALVAVPKGGTFPNYIIAFWDITIEDCVLQGGRYGAYVHAGNLTVADNLFQDNYRDALILAAVDGTTYIHHNHFRGATNSQKAILMEGGTEQPYTGGTVNVEYNTTNGKRNFLVFNVWGNKTQQVALNVIHNSLDNLGGPVVSFYAAYVDDPSGFDKFSAILVRDNIISHSGPAVYVDYEDYGGAPPADNRPVAAAGQIVVDTTLSYGNTPGANDTLDPSGNFGYLDQVGMTPAGASLAMFTLTGNLVGDPRYVDPAHTDDNFGLLGDSPALNAATDGTNIGAYQGPGAPLEVWVDDDWNSQADVDLYNPALVWQYDAFNVIQDGIDPLTPGGIVHVLTGTYTANAGPLAVIPKPLSLLGNGQEGAGASVLDGGAYGAGSDTSGLGNDWPRAMVVQTDTVTISGFKIANFQGDQVTTGGYAIVARAEAAWGVTASTIDDLTVQDVTFEDCYYGLRAQNVNTPTIQSTTYYTTTGVPAYASYIVSSDQATIQANQFTGGCIWVTDATNAAIGGPDPADGNLVRDAIYNGIWLGQQFAAGTSSSAGMIQNNVVDGAREGGIVVWNWPGETGNNIQILDNDVTGVRGGPAYPGWGDDDHGGISIRAGIFDNLVIRGNRSTHNAKDQTGLLIDGSTLNNPDIGDNVLAHNPGPGIRVAGTASGVVAHDNVICDNAPYQVENLTANPVDATGNWWGHNAPIQSGTDYAGTVTVDPNVERALTASPPAVDPAGGDTLVATVTYSDGASYTVPDGVVITWTVSGGTAAVPTTTVSSGSSSVQVDDDATAGLTITAEDCCGFSQQLVVQPGRVINLDTGEWFPTIQSAIDDADTLDGHTLATTPGVYAENVVVHKRIILQGTGSGTTAADTIVDVAAGHGFDLQVGGASPVDRLILRDLHVRGTSTTVSGSDGIYVNAPLSYVTLENVGLSGHYMGIYIYTNGGIDDLVVDRCHVDGNNYIGFYAQADAARNNNNQDLTNVLIQDSTFSENAYKGIYLEKLDNALLNNVSVIHSGYLCPQTYFNWPTGIDLNLKYGTYQNVTIQNSRVINSGNADVDASLCGTSGDLDLRAVGLTIKARDDGSYAGNPATLDNVLVVGTDVTNNRTGIRLGEPGQNNAGPTNAIVHHTRIIDNALYGFNNQTVAAITALDNWWGCNYGPGSTGPGCAGLTNPVSGTVPGTLSFDPWLVLDLAATPALLPAGGTSDLDADLTWNSSGSDTSGQGFLPDGITTTFAAAPGGVSPAIAGTLAGHAYSLFTAASLPGPAVVSSTVDAQTVTETLVVDHAAAASLLLAPDPYTVVAGDAVTYTVTAYDIYNNSWDATAAAAYGIESAAAGAWAANVYTSQVAGTWTVTATLGGLTSTATLTVMPAAATSLLLAPDPYTVVAGQSAVYTVTAQDAYNNSWDATAAAAYDIESAAAGAWSANTYISQIAGTWTVTATLNSLSANATLTVTHAPATSLLLSPDPYTVVAGDAVTYTVTAYDFYNNSWEATAAATYDVEPGAGGAWAANVYASQVSGTWTVTATLDGLDATATLTVTHAGASTLLLTPDPFNVIEGGSVTYAVTAYDIFSNSWDATASAAYDIEPGAGGTWAANVYSSQVAGTWTVTATLGAAWDTATLIVEPQFTGYHFYLPLVYRNTTTAPDLIVENLVVTADDIQVVIRNQGNAPATDDFWVDVYVDPTPPPAGVNDIWPNLSDQGLVWGVTADLQPGQSLTLTIDDAYYYGGLSHVVWPLVAGTPVYAQVDSANANTTYGAVLENHEIRGEAYNNITGPAYPAAIDLPFAPQVQPHGPSPALPARP